MSEMITYYVDPYPKFNYIDPMAGYIFQVDANRFCLGRPEKACVYFSLSGYIGLKEKIMKKYFHKRYADYMADMCQRSCGIYVFRMSKIGSGSGK